MIYQLTIQLGYPSTLLKAKNWEPHGLQKDDPAIRIQLNSHTESSLCSTEFTTLMQGIRVISDQVGDAPFFCEVEDGHDDKTEG